MKQLCKTITLALFCFALYALAASSAYAQEAKLDISHLERFSGTATELIDVTVDENLLQLATKFLNPKRSPEEAAVKEIVSNLKGVFVRRYGFDREGEFTDSDIESVRAQLRAPGWSRIVGVRSKKKSILNLDVYLMTQNGIIKGIAALAVEPKALTVVNVVGPIDLEKLSQLEGKFGIPKLDLFNGGATAEPESADKKPPTNQ